MPQHDPVPRRAPPRSPAGERPAALDDPAYARLAWGRFRRILRWMTLIAAIAGAVAVALLWRSNGPLPIHMAVATFLGVTLSIVMAAALMGLIFLSSGTGHDESVDRPDP